MTGGRSSRAKGVKGERESADVFRAHGFQVVQLQNNVLDAGDYLAVLPRVLAGESIAPVTVREAIEFVVDAKRRERLNLPVASQQVEAAVRPGQVGAVAYRRSREPWRISLLLDEFVRLPERLGV